MKPWKLLVSLTLAACPAVAIADPEGDANERNAVVVVTSERRVIEVFRNPPDAATKLRNTGPLETPTSPVLEGCTLCTANSDGGRRDNSPQAGGELDATAGPFRGKISCMEQRLDARGMPLPVR
jgi:hypothetical protein